VNDDAEAAAYFARRNAVVMPSSVPAGVRIELMRARLMTGKSARTDEWMRMLYDRYDECVTTLAGERVAFETIFRTSEVDGTEWIYHLAVYGEGGGLLDENSGSLDADHAAFGRECKERGWEILDPQLFIATPLVRAAMIRAATDPFGDTG